MPQAYVEPRRVSPLLSGTFRQRFEAKYRLNEFQAQAIRTCMAPFVVPDRLGGPRGDYPVNSLYLDSPDLRLFRGSKRGEKNRIKLRVRSYTQSPEDEAYLEIKRRVDQTIGKERADLPKMWLPHLFAGNSVAMSDAGIESPREREGFVHFRRLMESYQARPFAFIRYDREAYVGRMGDSVRITFDRRLCVRRCVAYQRGDWAEQRDWFPFFGDAVVLEIKFNNAFPRWVQDLIIRFNLLRDSVSKYVLGVLALQQNGRLHG